jgi:hypothetical protein
MLVVGTYLYLSINQSIGGRKGRKNVGHENFKSCYGKSF